MMICILTTCGLNFSSSDFFLTNLTIRKFTGHAGAAGGGGGSLLDSSRRLRRLLKRDNHISIQQNNKTKSRRKKGRDVSPGVLSLKEKVKR